MNFDFGIDDCDVDQKNDLLLYRERLHIWHEWAISDEHHSIWTQITEMLWGDAVYRLIDHVRRDRADGQAVGENFNWAIASLLDHGYVTTQTLAIRRLTEPNLRGDSISLRRLLADLRKNSQLFTREIYVCNDGLPFDPAPARERFYLSTMKTGKLHGELETKGKEAWNASERLHRLFDRMLEKPNDKHQRTDRLNASIFDRIEAHLKPCDEIRTYVAKFIAHASDKKSREGLSEEDRRITLNRISECHKAICQVTDYLVSVVLYLGGRHHFPIPQYNFLRGFNRPWCTSAHLGALRQSWDDHEKAVESWTSDNWIDGFLSEKLPD